MMLSSPTRRARNITLFNKWVSVFLLSLMTIPPSWVYAQTAPTIGVISNQTVNVGQRLSVPVTVRDPDVPPLALQFSLLQKPPTAIIRATQATNAVVGWTPTRDYADSTNFFVISVADNGTPSLSATQSFNVVVTDFAEAAVGTVVVPAGQDACLPITLDSSKPITNVSFTASWAPGTLTNLSIQPLVPELCVSNLQLLSPTQCNVTLAACPGQSLSLTQAVEVADLCFTAIAGQQSAFVPIAVTNSLLRTTSGQTLTNNQSGYLGRVVVVGNRSLLEASMTQQQQRRLILYAKLGRFYQVDWATNLSEPQPWHLSCVIPVTGSAQVICCADLTDPSKYFRALELGAGPTNQPPVVNAGPSQTIRTNVTTLYGSATDDGLPNACQPLTFLWRMFSGPGSVTFNSPTSAVATATFSQLGVYTLRLSVSDSQLTNFADVTITVKPPNQPPVAFSQIVTNLTGGGVPITLTAFDQDGDPLSYVTISSPTNGILTGTPPNLTYTPAPGSYGRDSFNFVANDGLALSQPATVSVVWLPGCLFAGAGGWDVLVSQPTSANPPAIPGSVQFTNCQANLTAGDSFEVAVARNLTIPTNAGLLAITYAGPTFDPMATNGIRSAFEAALVDPAGRPLTFTIQGPYGVTPAAASSPKVLPASPDAFFNLTYGSAAFIAPGAALLPSTPAPQLSILLVDVSQFAAGSAPRLVLRLLNNSHDRTASVQIQDISFRPSSPSLNLAGSPSTAFSLTLAAAANTAASLAALSPCGSTAPSFSDPVPPAPKTVSPTNGAPTVTILTPADNSRLIPGPGLLSGSAIARLSPSQPPGSPNTNRIVLVTVNGLPADALDAAGDFFSALQILPGQNSFFVVATDLLNQSTTNSVSVYGATCPDNNSGLAVVSASVQPGYGRTSYNPSTKTLY